MKVLIKHLRKLDQLSFIDNPDQLGLTPLHVAAAKGHSDIVEVISCIFILKSCDIYKRPVLFIIF